MAFAIPESYFLRFVSPSSYNTRNSFRGTGLPRASDASVYFHQYPLGWIFFSYEHVNKLLDAAKSVLPGLELRDLAPYMVQVWDIMARDTYMDPTDSAALAAGLTLLDNELTARLQDAAHRLQVGQARYINYLRDPYQPTPVPVNASNQNRSVRVATTTGSAQGGSFDTSATSAKVPKYQLPTVDALIKYA